MTGVINHEIEICSATYDEIRNNLTLALDLIEDCGQTYRLANDTIKRLLNQALFTGFHIYNDNENNVIVSELAQPFSQIFPAIKHDIADVNSAKETGSKSLKNVIAKAKHHIQTLFGCGAFSEHDKSPYPNESHFCGSNSLNKDFLVECTRRLVLRSKTNSWGVNSKNPK